MPTPRLPRVVRAIWALTPRELRIGGLATLALAAVFLVFTVTTSDVRRDLARDVGRSFAATLDRELARPDTRAHDTSCRKTGSYAYDCSAMVVAKGRKGRRVAYKLAITDDGCWTATTRRDAVRGTGLTTQIKGCVKR